MCQAKQGTLKATASPQLPHSFIERALFYYWQREPPEKETKIIIIAGQILQYQEKKLHTLYIYIYIYIYICMCVASSNNWS